MNKVPKLPTVPPPHQPAIEDALIRTPQRLKTDNEKPENKVKQTFSANSAASDSSNSNTRPVSPTTSGTNHASSLPDIPDGNVLNAGESAPSAAAELSSSGRGGVAHTSSNLGTSLPAAGAAVHSPAQLTTGASASNRDKKIGPTDPTAVFKSKVPNQSTKSKRKNNFTPPQNKKEKASLHTPDKIEEEGSNDMSFDLDDDFNEEDDDEIPPGQQFNSQSDAQTASPTKSQGTSINISLDNLLNNDNLHFPRIRMALILPTYALYTFKLLFV